MQSTHLSLCIFAVTVVCIIQMAIQSYLFPGPSQQSQGQGHRGRWNEKICLPAKVQNPRQERIAQSSKESGSSRIRRNSYG